MHDPELKLSICVENIVAKGTVSPNSYIGLGSFSVKFRKKYSKKNNKKLPVFCHKIQNNT